MIKALTGGILLVAILCGGCASTAGKAGFASNSSGKHGDTTRLQPEWVSGESKTYPRLDYITSRAQADSVEAATQQLNTNISRMFMVDLAQYDISERQAEVSGGYKINRTFQTEDAMTSAAPEIERILGKIEVVDQWYDSSSNTHHVLAALPRNSGLGYLRSQIEMLDGRTETFLKTAKEGKDPLTRMGQTALAWRAQQLRSTLQQSMREVDLTRRGIEPRWPLEALQQDINNQLMGLKIYPSGVAGDANAELLGNALNNALTIADLKPSKEKQADYKISATVDSAVVGEKGGWALGQGTIKLKLSDKQNRERSHTQWVVEVSGINGDAALRRVLEKSEFTLKKELRNSLIDMALGE